MPNQRKEANKVSTNVLLLKYSKLELKCRNGINKTFELEPLIWGWVYQQFSKPINTIRK